MYAVDVNVANLLAGPLADRAQEVALVDGTDHARRTTFAELDVAARRMSARLRSDGLRAGAHALFFAPPSADLYAALVAVWRIGAVATFVEPSAGRAVLDAACARCRPHAFIASPKAHLLRAVSPGLRAIPRKYVIGSALRVAKSLRNVSIAPDEAVATVHADDLALLTFTSGSTGSPKGAKRSHAILRAQLTALSAAFAAKRGERELVALPIVVLLNLANGVETVLPDADLSRADAIDARRVLEQIRTLQVTRLVGSPAFMERLADCSAASAALAKVHTIVTGGGPVFPDLVQRLRQVAPSATVISVYGSTEAEPIAHIANHEVSEADLHAMTRGGGLLTGHPVNDVQLRLLRITVAPIAVDSDMEFDTLSVHDGEAGEIVVSGSHVVTGNLGGVGDAESKIRVQDTVWHRTGDVGRLDDAGRLWLLGRINATSSDARGTFYPFTVECAARMTLGVRRVAAFARDGRRVLVLERDDLREPSASTAQAQLSWASLDDVLIVKKIPMDKRHNSKVDYPALWRLLS